jgi:S1-C subfamily serine protease
MTKHYQPPVLRVFTTALESCFDLPWQTKRPNKGTGSGVYLGNGEILTGAHVIQDATFIQVQKLSAPDKIIAHVSSICHDCDLALLSVDDSDFLKDLEPASIGELPNLRDRVEVVGFPTGGEQVSITNGVVSRIEVGMYSHSWRHLLCATIDAAINPGNSGGPVFSVDGKIVGLAFQKNTRAENSGQMVPPPIIKNFLESARQGQKEVKIPTLGISIQSLENPALKKKFKVPLTQSGLLINTVDFGSSCEAFLQPGDIIHRMGEYDISNMGTILYKNQYRTRISALLSELSVGDVLPMTRRRNGEVSQIEVPLKAGIHLANRDEGIENRFFIHAGFVFQPLTRKYLQTWKNFSQAPAALRHYYETIPRSQARQELVVLGQILSDEVNIGYSSFYYDIITHMNHIPIQNLNHLAYCLSKESGIIELRTLDQSWIIIDADLAQKRHQVILDRYQIPIDSRGVTPTDCQPLDPQSLDT